METNLINIQISKHVGEKHFHENQEDSFHTEAKGDSEMSNCGFSPLLHSASILASFVSICDIL